MSDKTTHKWLLTVLAICLILRIGLSIYLKDAEVISDAYNYRAIGRNLADGNGFSIDQGYGGDSTGKTHPTAYGDPIYPAFLAAIYATMDEDLHGIGVPSVSIVQSVLDTLTCFLVFLFTLRLLRQPKAALAAAAIYAIYPPFIISVCTPMTETCTILLTVVAAYLLMKAIGSGAKDYVLAGAAMGLLILLKPAMLAFPFAVIVMLFTIRGRTPGWVWKAAVYVGVAYLVVSPWTIRNYRVFHAFIPVATHGGSTLWAGTGPADGVCLSSWSYPVASVADAKPENDRIPVLSVETYRKITSFQLRLSKMSEVQVDRTLMGEARKEIRQHPARYAFLAVKKFFRLWFNLWGDFHASMNTYLIAGLNAILLVLGVLGYRRAKVDHRLRLVSLCICGYTTIICMLTFALIRYSYPVMPFVIVLAAAFVCRNSAKAAALTATDAEVEVR